MCLTGHLYYRWFERVEWIPPQIRFNIYRNISKTLIRTLNILSKLFVNDEMLKYFVMQAI
jgi:hypothetical protein